MDENKMLEAQQRLAEILNDTPHLVNLEGTQYAVTRLKNGTQYMICEEAAKVQMQENAAFGDVMKSFAVNMPSVVKVLTLAVLNDKKRIFKDGDNTKGYSDEYGAVYDTFMWEIGNDALANLLFEVFSMLDVNFFLTSSSIVKTMREMMTKTTKKEKPQS
ncbi:MAG: hypothetical protein II630_08005 [Bacteroidales bacterium]|nr:hypothetical protein [Bacteroidales bacterium]